jgi:hypothetical protein
MRDVTILGGAIEMKSDIVVAQQSKERKKPQFAAFRRMTDSCQ